MHRHLRCGPVLAALLVAAGLLLGLLQQGGIRGATDVSERDAVLTWRFAVGDDPRWSSPEYEDGTWKSGPASAAPNQVGVLWARTEVRLGAGCDVPGLLVSAAGAREVYWDGVLVGNAGRVGASADLEQSGPLDAFFGLPTELAGPGLHRVAIRFSTFLRPSRTSSLLLDFQAGDLRELIRRSQRSATWPLAFVGGFVLLAIYFGVLAFAPGARLAQLASAVLCLAVATLAVSEGWRSAVGYPYHLHGLRLSTIELATWWIGVSLVGSLILQFRTPLGAWVAAGSAASTGVAILLLPDHETAMWSVHAIALPTALGITLQGQRDRRHGAGFAMGGVVICLICLGLYGRDFLDEAFFPAFGALLAGLLVSRALGTRLEQLRSSKTRATAARLEAELLRKHLQPHFLMNTLTTILEWVETDPPRGARALEALAEELRSLTEMAGESLVSMDRELALCRAHLEVMGNRRGVEFELDTAGVHPSTLIPPALLHTLVENAVSHNAYRAGRVTFLLREERRGSRRELEFRSPLAGAPRTARPEGGGLRYVRTRLEESFPGEWELRSRAEGEQWVTRITWSGSVA